MATERYKLIVSGTVTFTDDDTSLRDLLLSVNDDRAKIPEALQELEEEATDVTVTMEKLS